MSIAKNQKHERLDSRKPKQPRKPMPQIEFANIRLTKADREELVTFEAKLNDLILDPLDMLVNVGGYKVSIRYDSDSDSILVSITGTDDSANPNICVTTYGGDINECLIMTLYKAYDINRAEWIVWAIEDTSSQKRWG